MKIDVTQNLQEYDGTPFKELTFRSATVQLLNGFRDDEPQTAELKDRCYALARKLYEGKEVTLTIKESSLIIERAEAVGTVFVQGEVKRILESKEPNDTQV